jgi:hypothetical protein
MISSYRLILHLLIYWIASTLNLKPLFSYSQRSFWKILFKRFLLGYKFLAIFINIKIVDTDQYRALDCANIVTEYARVNDISEKSITLDNVKYGSDSSSSEVEKKYPIDLKNFKIGDIVMYQYISTDFANYVIKIEKIKWNQTCIWC